jgi:cytidylate kinase|tara:strand:- start:793 stop:1464 length:672 start_codon:yes stop_codon:yes gene_type:complete
VENLKLKKYHKLIIAADGGAASGKTTGAKKISKKYGLKFLSSGILYRFASYQLLKQRPKNKIVFLRKIFNKLNLEKLNKINLHTAKISEHTSIIAKEKKIRLILKLFQRRFAKKFKKVCIEGRDIGTIILPKADIKFYFVCSLDVAAKRRFKELRKKDKNVKLIDVKKSLKIRNYRDKNRKNSPLIQSKDAVIVRTDKLKNIPGMINKMSEIMEKKIKEKYGS